MSPKKRVVKDYDALPEEIVMQVKKKYTHGFAQHLIFYTNSDGKKVSALPFETDDIYYLIRMTQQEAKQIIEEDEDYDQDGNLKEDYALEDDYVADKSYNADNLAEEGDSDHYNMVRDDREDPDY